MYLCVRKISNRREQSTHGELDPTLQTERRNVPSQVILHLRCVYHFNKCTTSNSFLILLNFIQCLTVSLKASSLASRHHSVLFHPIVPCRALSRKQMDKTKIAVSFVITVFTCYLQWDLTQSTTTIILTATFMSIVLANVTTTFRAMVLLFPMHTNF